MSTIDATTVTQAEDAENDVPGAWNDETYFLNGNFKLVARFEHPSGAKVYVTPYKTYDGPGFDNAHRVARSDSESRHEVVAEGMEIEDPADAKAVAWDLMESYPWGDA